jgi:hypothetical protein
LPLLGWKQDSPDPEGPSQPTEFQQLANASELRPRFQLLDLATAPASVQISPITASFLLACLPSAWAAALRDRYPLERGRGGMSSRGLP